MTFTVEPVSLALGLSAAAGVGVLQLVRRLRRNVRVLRDDLRVAQGRVLVSEGKPRSGRPPTPRDAEVVLWLDARGEVAGCEGLQEEWSPEPPGSLHELFGVSTSSRLLERASRQTPVALGLARVDADTLAEVSILRLADADENTWGYTLFLRRVAASPGASGTSPDSSGSSRSASLPSRSSSLPSPTRRSVSPSA